MDLAIDIWRHIGELPHFNPDLEGARLPSTVTALRTAADNADGLLIACPEYARGIPGAFKNALDWLVGSEKFSAKPVALFNASPRAHEAQAALRLVLATMSAIVVEQACGSFPLISTSLTAEQIAADPAMGTDLQKALRNYVEFLSASVS